MLSATERNTASHENYLVVSLCISKNIKLYKYIYFAIEYKIINSLTICIEDVSMQTQIFIFRGTSLILLFHYFYIYCIRYTWVEINIVECVVALAKYVFCD